MKVQSAKSPEKVVITQNGNEADISLLDSVVSENEITDDDGNVTKTYDYIIYKIKTSYRESLEKDIKENFGEWLEKAKNAEKEQLAVEVRAKRNKLLEATDKDVLPDRESANSEAIIAYRKALRDIPEQAEFPYRIKWPHKPQGV
ncbi:MAG: tail fiber assembly protein [Eubacterium sp.]